MEDFVKIKGFENYFINKEGQVYFSGGKGKRNYRSPGYVKSTLAKNGYYIVHLDGKTYYVHRLLADAFLENPDHIDGNPKNNSLDNLRWATHKENLNNSVSVQREINSHLGLPSNIKGRRKVWIDKEKKIYKMI